MHGGDRYRNKVQHDFSININPLGMPKSVKEALLEAADLSTSYPDYRAQELLEALAREWKQKTEAICLGNGASELLMAAAHGLKPKKVLLTAPSFTGYEHICDAVDAKREYFFLKKDTFSMDESFLDFIKKETDLIILTSPNNPNGKYIEKDLLRKILKKAEELDCLVLLDECFMELSDRPEQSMISELGAWKNLLILRAFTKSFAIPAVRLGYLLSENRELLGEIRKHLPEWNLSLAAQKAGIAALKEKESLKEARKQIQKERNYLKNVLEREHFKVADSDSCFLLFQGEEGLYQKLLEEGILIRDCSDYRGLSKKFYRVAVKGHEENMAFADAIKKCRLVK